MCPPHVLADSRDRGFTAERAKCFDDPRVEVVLGSHGESGLYASGTDGTVRDNARPRPASPPCDVLRRHHLCPRAPLQALITMYVGIDVSAKCLHCVAIDDAGRIQSVRLADPDEAVELVPAYTSPVIVAVDAPSSLSTRPHAADPNPRLAPKFRPARCAEIELNLRHRIAVPWVTPAGPPVPPWMEAGFRVFEAFGSAGVEVIEVYPHAAFRVLYGSRLPRKTTRQGVSLRVDALASRGISGNTLPMWSHDGLDALVAAVVARDYANEDAVRVTCGHDDSAIWLPAPGACV